MKSFSVLFALFALTLRAAVVLGDNAAVSITAPDQGTAWNVGDLIGTSLLWSDVSTIAYTNVRVRLIAGNDPLSDPVPPTLQTICGVGACPAIPPAVSNLDFVLNPSITYAGYATIWVTAKWQRTGAPVVDTLSQSLTILLLCPGGVPPTLIDDLGTGVCPTPTPTPTPSATPTFSATPSSSRTATRTPTVSRTPTKRPTATPSKRPTCPYPTTAAGTCPSPCPNGKPPIDGKCPTPTPTCPYPTTTAGTCPTPCSDGKPPVGGTCPTPTVLPSRTPTRGPTPGTCPDGSPIPPNGVCEAAQSSCPNTGDPIPPDGACICSDGVTTPPIGGQCPVSTIPCVLTQIGSNDFLCPKAQPYELCCAGACAYGNSTANKCCGQRSCPHSSNCCADSCCPNTRICCGGTCCGLGQYCKADLCSDTSRKRRSGVERL